MTVATAPLRRLVECLDGKRVPLNAEQRSEIKGEIPYWGANGVVDHIDRHLFDEELVLLGEDGAPFGDRLRDVAFRIHGKAWVNNHIHVLRPLRGVDARFLTYALNSIDWQPFTTGSTREKLTQDGMMRVPVWSPPSARQAAIADFLDRETGRIDALVEKKRRLIDLLEEKRTALISHVVTKGLDPTVPMKNSGIPWLGEIPAHWGVSRVKDLVSGVTSGSRNWAQFYSDDGHLFLTITNIQRQSIELDLTSSRFVQPPESAETRRTALRRRDVLMSITADTGSVAVVDASVDLPAFISQHVAALRPLASTDSRWLAYRLKGWDAQVQVDAARYGGTKQQLSLPDVATLRLGVPPSLEQRQIAEVLTTRETKSERAIKLLRSQLDLLAEYRQALITAAVTGQIDLAHLHEVGEPAC